MRKLVVLLIAFFLATHCAWMHNVRTGTAREGALQALVTTTRSAVLLMTAAGIAYDAGAFGAPGSTRAEDTWRKIASESIRMNQALTSWSEAIKANKDSSVYSSMVAQALAVIGALLPTRGTSALTPPPWIAPREEIAALDRPSMFRPAVAAAGGF